MTTRKIGIEVEAKASGSGLRKTEKDAKELDEALKRLDKTFQASKVGRFTDELKEARNRSRQWVSILAEISDEMARANRETHDYRQQTEKVKQSVAQAFRAQDQMIDTTERLTRSTAEGGREAFDYFKRYSKVITTLNQGRFHTVEMAKAVGLLSRETGQGKQEFHQYGAEIEQFRQSVRELDTTLSTLNLSIKNLTENLEKSERKMNAGEVAVDALGTELQDTGDRAYYLNEALFESETQLHIWQNRAAAAEAKAQALGLEVKEAGQDIEQAGQDIREAARHTDSLEDELGDLARSVQTVDQKLSRLDRSLKDVDKGLSKGQIRAEAWAEVYGNIVSEALEEAAQAAFRFAQDSLQAFYDFDRGTREIFTLIPESSGEMREALKADVLALGTELGRLPDEMLPAVYNALSAGIPESNVLSAVETASQAARAGVSDLDTTLKLGVAILNAQVGGVSTLDDVYDQLFFTVKNGVVTMPELTDVMSQVTSIAGEAGVSMQDISAAMIVMTRQGDSAAEAAELLSIMLTQLSTSGTTLASVFEEAAGKSFRTFVAEGGTLAGAMEILQRHAKNTGQALGDILGGGSPFFRDTQAARGALELTGKHLDDLVKFSNQAEKAAGSMAQASAEMGEAAELGALQGKAAFAEFKIEAGEAAAVIAGPLIGHATEFLKVWSGNRENQVGGLVDDLIESTSATGDYAEAVQRLTKAYGEANSGTGKFLVDQGTRNQLMEAGVDVLRAVAAESANVEEFQRKIEELNLETWTHATAGQIAVINDMTIEVEKFYDEAQANRTAEILARDLENVDAKMMQLTSTFAAANHYAPPTVATLREASVAALELSDSLSSYGDEDIGSGLNKVALDAIAAKEELIAANTEIAAVAEDRANRIAAAAEAEREAISASREAYNGYALSVLGGAEVETNWVNALFQTAGQMDINQGQFRELAIASGEYSEAQIRAALTEAAMRGAVEELSGQLRDGNITVGEAVQMLGDFEDALANDYTATLEFDDFVRAEEQARATKDALLAAEGDYSAKFTTHNVTVNETVTKTTGSGSTETALHEGGDFRAGELLLVGDGPGGKFVPGLSEFVVFDQPGTVIGADESARIFANQSLPPNLNPQGGQLADSSTGKAPVQITIHLYEASNRDIEDSLLRALQRGGLTN